MPNPISAGEANNRHIVVWLAVVAGLTAFMVLLGGVTRLTESGLSMVDWHPVTGWLPPMSDAAWEAEFAKYRTSPEFQKVNSYFTVADFKTIFWFEFLHRLLGRLIGVAFAVPFFWFLLRGRIERPLIPRLVFLLILGGLQGVMGWYMVKSGLVDRPSVSQYRLAAHLGLAFIIFGYLIWLILGLTKPSPTGKRLNRFAVVLTAIVSLQIISGALVAGLDAGFDYNTWPLIDGAFVPGDIFSNPSFWPGVFEDIRQVQFSHRMIAYLIVVLVGLFWWRNRGAGAPVHALGLVMLYQVAAGILTVVWLPYIPAWLAVFHQAGGLALFGVAVWVMHQVRQNQP